MEETICTVCHGRGLDDNDMICPHCHGSGLEPVGFEIDDEIEALMLELELEHLT